MDRFEKKALKIIREMDMYDQLRKLEIISDALRQEYKNGNRVQNVPK